MKAANEEIGGSKSPGLATELRQKAGESNENNGGIIYRKLYSSHQNINRGSMKI